MFSLKNALKRIIERFGFRVSRVPRLEGKSLKFAPDPEDQFKWLASMNIDIVVDVGAHTGESASLFLNIFPGAKVYSFEPLADCFASLSKLSETSNRLVPFNMALGASTGQAKINRSSFSPSSSILRMGDTHKNAFPFTSGETSEVIQMSTLDIQSHDFPSGGNVLLKIDTQGYEMQVLLGATKFLDRVSVIIVELSFLSLYKEQPLFADVYKWLESRGFLYRGSWGQLYDPRDGTPIQQDGIFVRS